MLWPRTISQSPHRVVVGPVWKRRPVATVMILALGAAAVLGRGDGPGGDDHVAYHNRVAAVTRVVDSLSFEIDLPDRDHPCTRVKLCGLREREGDSPAPGPVELDVDVRVRLLLPPSRTRDVDGCLLAYVVLADSGVNLNERLVAEGIALADSAQDHPLKSKFVALERRAKKRGAGLWATAAPQVHASSEP